MKSGSDSNIGELYRSWLRLLKRTREIGCPGFRWLRRTRRSIPVLGSQWMNNLLDSADPSLYDIRSKAPGPQGSLPITPEMLLQRPSGDLFGWAQNAGMGWDPREL